MKRKQLLESIITQPPIKFRTMLLDLNQPVLAPDGKPLSATGGQVELEYRGSLSALLGWLNQHAPTDVRIEPLGLAPLYARIHGSVE